MDEGLKVVALAVVGYPVSVIAAVLMGVPVRYAWRQAVAVYVVVWAPLMAVYLWLR